MQREVRLRRTLMVQGFLKENVDLKRKPWLQKRDWTRESSKEPRLTEMLKEEVRGDDLLTLHVHLESLRVQLMWGSFVCAYT